MIRVWEELPVGMKKPEVREYYDILATKTWSLRVKRGFDLIVASILLIFLTPVILVLSLLISIDSSGGIFYRQERVTIYGKKFKIHKFRTMVKNGDQIGQKITGNHDERVTKIGAVLRKYRLDELPQLIDIIQGNMSFVGTRPEIPQFVRKYTPEMRATLLLPAGITSEASIRYKDEAVLLDGVSDIEKVYLEKILPEKMKYNLESIRNFSLKADIMIMVRTLLAVLKHK